MLEEEGQVGLPQVLLTPIQTFSHWGQQLLEIFFFFNFILMLI